MAEEIRNNEPAHDGDVTEAEPAPAASNTAASIAIEASGVIAIDAARLAGTPTILELTNDVVDEIRYRAERSPGIPGQTAHNKLARAMQYLLPTERMLTALSTRDMAEIYRLLLGAGLNQRELGRIIGRGQATISNTINARHRMPDSSIPAIAERLCIPLWLLGLTPTPPTIPPEK